ncbi:phospho-acceptor domain-containing protein [Archangium gephyra]|uniref:histidine kinase n=1 Tax=Archangium gephyra TaxID=48 RepID=A0AAC8THR5_9BACT|nr:HAMP domain-containing sensor histidine kinase [Archangium gephyra]AKJ04846.1 Phosphate regulon sensor protein PhoR [Archangium gephyra]REG37109.1 phospho-acceptor domain-containing protein [Archangium gephyra]
MLRRLLPTLVALGCGLLALTWGLVSLQRIFAQEREDARAQLASRRYAVEEYATQSLRYTLGEQLKGNLTALHAAMGDPLAPGEGFLLNFRGHQFLPRLTRSARGSRATARRHYRELVKAFAEGAPAEPWGERLVRLRAVEEALDKGRVSRAHALAEELLHYHAKNPLPPVQELPFVLLMLERLQRGEATPPLVRALLREGLPEDFGGIERSAGLQRDLLRERWRFTQPDFTFLLAHIVQVSTALGEPSDDFLARAREADAGMLVIPESLPGPTLIGQRWYVEQQEEVVRGIAVDLDALLRDLAQELRRRNHFGADGLVRLRDPDAVQPVESLWLEVSVPAWTAAENALEQRYGLKTLLVATCGALAVAIVVMAVVAQHGRYRYVELKSDFVATVSHELRTPLASIRLLAETMERKLSKLPEMRDYPERIIQAADGLHFLVENILSFNRIDKGRWQLKPARVKLDELLGMLRSDLVGNTSVPVQLTADVGDVELEVDPSLLRLLFINLARNACAYNRRNPVELTVRAYPHQGHGCVVLFGDNGIGIPEAEWDNVFRDFYRLSSQGPEVHGSGLGLALCRRIMSLHGGRISIDQSSPQGTTFSLLFPEPRHERPEQPS